MKILVFQTPTCNISNILNALNHLGFDYSVAGSDNNIQNFDVLIIPGVGNYGYVMSELIKTDIKKIISHFIEHGKLVIGICLGFQLLFDGSDEAPNVSGLGFLKGHFKLLPTRFNIKPPKIGFSETIFKTSTGKYNDTYDFYYLHKYALFNTSSQFDVVGYSRYNLIEYISYVKENNIIGCQFHPELSGNAGLEFLKNTISER